MLCDSPQVKDLKSLRQKVEGRCQGLGRERQCPGDGRRGRQHDHVMSLRPRPACLQMVTMINLKLHVVYHNMNKCTHP